MRNCGSILAFGRVIAMPKTDQQILKQWLTSVSMVMLTHIIAAIGVLFWSYFELQELKKDMESVKPRVEQLWWTRTAKSETIKKELYERNKSMVSE